MTHLSPTRRALFCGLAAALMAAAMPVSAQDIGGSYRAEGRNSDGSSYSGTVQINENGGAIEMQWQIGSRSFAGVVTRNGDVVRVNWGDAYPVVYVRMPSGELHGTWSNGRALERLIP